MQSPPALRTPSTLPPPVEQRFTVGVVLERRVLDNPWTDHMWLPDAILPTAPDVAPWTVLRTTATATQIYAGPYEVELHSIDTGNYKSNLEGGAPRVWVAIRPAEGPHLIQIAGVTVDPAEGEAYTEAGNDTVEALPMPPGVAAIVAAFVEDHHIERGFFKRKRGNWDGQAGSGDGSKRKRDREEFDDDD